jgi:hypothetical protein
VAVRAAERLPVTDGVPVTDILDEEDTELLPFTLAEEDDWGELLCVTEYEFADDMDADMESCAELEIDALPEELKEGYGESLADGENVPEGVLDSTVVIVCVIVRIRERVPLDVIEFVEDADTVGVFVRRPVLVMVEDPVDVDDSLADFVGVRVPTTDLDTLILPVSVADPVDVRDILLLLVCVPEALTVLD